MPGYKSVERMLRQNRQSDRDRRFVNTWARRDAGLKDFNNLPVNGGRFASSEDTNLKHLQIFSLKALQYKQAQFSLESFTFYRDAKGCQKSIR